MGEAQGRIKQSMEGLEALGFHLKIHEDSLAVPIAEGELSSQSTRKLYPWITT